MGNCVSNKQRNNFADGGPATTSGMQGSNKRSLKGIRPSQIKEGKAYIEPETRPVERVSEERSVVPITNRGSETAPAPASVQPQAAPSTNGEPKVPPENLSVERSDAATSSDEQADLEPPVTVSVNRVETVGSMPNSVVAPKSPETANSTEATAIPEEPVNDPGEAVIFWDLENCAIPKGVDVEILAKRLWSLRTPRGFAPKEIIATAHLNRFPRSATDILRRSDITMLNCSSRKASSADFLLLEEMSRWERRHNPPGGVILITSDADFVHRIESLINEGFDMVLIHQPRITSYTLKAVVESRLLWPDLCRGQLDGSSFLPVVDLNMTFKPQDGSTTVLLSSPTEDTVLPSSSDTSTLPAIPLSSNHGTSGDVDADMQDCLAGDAEILHFSELTPPLINLPRPISTNLLEPPADPLSSPTFSQTSMGLDSIQSPASPSFPITPFEMLSDTEGLEHVKGPSAASDRGISGSSDSPYQEARLWEMHDLLWLIDQAYLHLPSGYAVPALTYAGLQTLANYGLICSTASLKVNPPKKHIFLFTTPNGASVLKFMNAVNNEFDKSSRFKPFKYAVQFWLLYAVCHSENKYPRRNDLEKQLSPLFLDVTLKTSLGLPLSSAMDYIDNAVTYDVLTAIASTAEYNNGVLQLGQKFKQLRRLADQLMKNFIAVTIYVGTDKSACGASTAERLAKILRSEAPKTDLLLLPLLFILHSGGSEEQTRDIARVSRLFGYATVDEYINEAEMSGFIVQGGSRVQLTSKGLRLVESVHRAIV